MSLLAAAPPKRARSRLVRAAQRFEDVVRFAWLRAVVETARTLFGRNDTLPPNRRRVLFICEDAIGDLVLTLPALRAIAESSPGTTVDLVTSDYAVDLVRHLPYIRRVIVFPRYDRRRLRAVWTIFRHGPYDVVVDGMVLRSHVRTRSIAMMLGSRAPVWIGESQRANDHVFSIRVPRRDPSTQHAERMLQLALPFTDGEEQLTSRPQLELTAAEVGCASATWASARGSGDRILVNLSASCWQRRWPDEKFAEVLDHIRAFRPSAPLIIVGLARDADSATTLAERTAGVAVVPTLRELIALIATSHVVLSPDTAVCHMAAAFERTLISLNLRDHESWATAPTPGVRVVGPSDETFEGLEPPEVIDAVAEVLGARRAELPSHDFFAAPV
jgi:ADP-heptose:LPS heptosyltransferase